MLADPSYKMIEQAKMGGIHTVLGVPMLRQGTPIGVIILQRKAVKPFTDKQIESVATFADQAVIAIENVRLFDEVQARTRESVRGAGAADGDLGGAQCHQLFARRADACVSDDA